MKAMKGRDRLIALTVLLLAGTATLNANDMYRWVDADGKVHYSDQPPPPGAKNVRTLTNSGAQSMGSSEYEQGTPSYVEQETAFQERQAKRAEEQAKAEAAKMAAAERQRNCQLARSNYNTVSVGGRVTRVNAQGEREFLSDEEIERDTVEARKAIEKWCSDN